MFRVGKSSKDAAEQPQQPTPQNQAKQPRVFVNPEILDPAEELSVYQEGCLSVPEIYADVERPARCRVRCCAGCGCS